MAYEDIEGRQQSLLATLGQLEHRSTAALTLFGDNNGNDSTSDASISAAAIIDAQILEIMNFVRSNGYTNGNGIVNNVTASHASSNNIANGISSSKESKGSDPKKESAKTKPSKKPTATSTPVPAPLPSVVTEPKVSVPMNTPTATSSNSSNNDGEVKSSGNVKKTSVFAVTIETMDRVWPHKDADTLEMGSIVGMSYTFVLLKVILTSSHAHLCHILAPMLSHVLL
jgi:hypothetical protein